MWTDVYDYPPSSVYTVDFCCDLFSPVQSFLLFQLDFALCDIFELMQICYVSEDVLTDDKGECVICLEDLQQGDTIARLPCLCIYHKRSVVSCD
jgi:hypothetical protein